MIKNIFTCCLLIIATSNAMNQGNQFRFGEAIKQGNLEEARAVWAAGEIDINGSIMEEVYTIYTALGGFDVTEKTYLYVAVEKANALVQFLLESGADANKIVAGHCPLDCAIYLKNENTLRLLLKHGALPSRATFDYARAVHPPFIPLLEQLQISKLY